MEIPATQEEVCAIVVETIRQNDLHDGYVRLVITRGTGGLGLSPYRCEKVSIIVIASTISLYPREKYEQALSSRPAQPDDLRMTPSPPR